MIDAETRERVLRHSQSSTFAQTIGIRIIELGEGWAKATLQVKPELGQREGIAHGGVVTALLDHVGGMATLTRLPEQYSIVAAEMTISFLQPAQGDLVAFGQTIRIGKRRCVAQAKVWPTSMANDHDLRTLEAEPLAVGLLNLAPIPRNTEIP